MRRFAGQAQPPFGRHPTLLAARLPARRLVDLVGEAAAVDPAAAGSGAVGVQLRVAGERPAVGAPAVDLAQDCLRARLLEMTRSWVDPGEIKNRPVLRVS